MGNRNAVGKKGNGKLGNFKLAPRHRVAVSVRNREVGYFCCQSSSYQIAYAVYNEGVSTGPTQHITTLQGSLILLRGLTHPDPPFISHSGRRGHHISRCMLTSPRRSLTKSITPVLSRTFERVIVREFIYPAILEPPVHLSCADQYAFRPTASTTAAIVDHSPICYGTALVQLVCSGHHAGF